jgi:hypothetical protein
VSATWTDGVVVVLADDEHKAVTRREGNVQFLFFEEKDDALFS